MVKIGDINLGDFPLLLAPMEDVSDPPFRALCKKYGADTLRLYEMFLGPIEQSKPWSMSSISGVHNFLKKTWKLFHLRDNFEISNFLIYRMK